jgi:hypothetical protein
MIAPFAPTVATALNEAAQSDSPGETAEPMATAPISVATQTNPRRELVVQVDHSSSNTGHFDPNINTMPGVTFGKSILHLPAHVVAPKGEVTLFADFENVKDGTIELFLVNRKKNEAKFNAQDGDIYLKQEYQNRRGEWIRLDPHQSSWCGNSYFGGTILGPDTFVSYQRSFQRSGTPGRVRYRRYSSVEPVISNSGPGMIPLVPEAEQYLLDSFPLDGASFEALVEIALRGTKRIPLFREPRPSRDEYRIIAVEKLLRYRNQPERVEAILGQLAKSGVKKLAPRAWAALVDRVGEDGAKKALGAHQDFCAGRVVITAFESNHFERCVE